MKQSKIYCRQAFAASTLRPLHQVYGKMLNYMNKCVHLPKMVPLKSGCKGVRGVWVFGVYGEVLWIWKLMGKAPPSWDHTYQTFAHAPHLLYGTLRGSRSMDGVGCMVGCAI